METILGLSSHFLWELCWFIANVVLIGRRAFISYREESASASKKFALRSNSLPYVTVWAVCTILMCVFGAFTADGGACINIGCFVVAEFVLICLWGHYYANGDLVCKVVAETRERLDYLLVQGLGMNRAEREQFWMANEDAIVALWTKRLKEKKWKALTIEERDALLFDTGSECGKVLELQLSEEGVLYDFTAFFHEWCNEVEDLRGSVRVPRNFKCRISENDAGRQALLCIAVVVANEDVQLRTSHAATQPFLPERQFCAARIARRKAAAEGILKWPDSVTSGTRVEIGNVESNSSELRIVNGLNEYPCTGNHFSESVRYTIAEMIRAGYIKIQANGTFTVDVAFKYGSMVFNRDEWNTQGTIKRKPFRYITSATWLAGDVAFVVEQREISGVCSFLDGSAFLKGTLKLWGMAHEIDNSNSWAERATQPDENQSVWGEVGRVIDSKPLSVLHWPTMWMIESAGWIFEFCANLYSNRVRPLLRNSLSRLMTKWCQLKACCLCNRRRLSDEDETCEERRGLIVDVPRKADFP